MDNPDLIGELHGIHNAECIATQRQRNFEDAGPEALHWFYDVSLAALGRDRQRS